jgi:hypothetical protein
MAYINDPTGEWDESEPIFYDFSETLGQVVDRIAWWDAREFAVTQPGT